MKNQMYQHFASEIQQLRDSGLYKSERVITSPQSAHIESEHKEVINFCANNYLGLSNHPDLVKAAQQAVEEHGFGLSSVRFICGTQDIHKKLENRISQFLEKEDTILYSSCFDANTGLFETILGPEDAIISDALNHASIIDGVRLCKAHRFRYENSNMADLRAKLVEAKQKNSRFILIATDGVFSMDGYYAKLPEICDLADEFGAYVMVDDSHAVGFVGEGGRGTPEYCGVLDRVDILTGTLGKALGGASGGYTSGKREVIEWLRQRSRPYLFSNSLAPVIAKTSVVALDLIEKNPDLRKKLFDNANRFREKMQAHGFELLPGEHAIIPVMLHDAALASKMADELLEQGIYVIGFSFPVVPRGQARIRTQMSAAHSFDDIDKAVAAFAQVGKKLGVI